MKTKKLPIKVCGHYVLIKPDKFEKVSKGGIITATDKEAARYGYAQVKGTIVGIGPNAWVAFGGEPWAELGAHVYFKKHVQDQIFDEDNLDENGKPEEYFLMTDENVLAVIEE